MNRKYIVITLIFSFSIFTYLYLNNPKRVIKSKVEDFSQLVNKPGPVNPIEDAGAANKIGKLLAEKVQLAHKERGLPRKTKGTYKKEKLQEIFAVLRTYSNRISLELQNLSFLKLNDDSAIVQSHTKFSVELNSGESHSIEKPLEFTFIQDEELGWVIQKFEFQ